LEVRIGYLSYLIAHRLIPEKKSSDVPSQRYILNILRAGADHFARQAVTTVCASTVPARALSLREHCPCACTVPARAQSRLGCSRPTWGRQSVAGFGCLNLPGRPLCRTQTRSMKHPSREVNPYHDSQLRSFASSVEKQVRNRCGVQR
jgi:hypothetical protein